MTVLFVESNSTGTGALFATRARARGLEPILLARDPGRYGYIADLRLHAIAIDTGDIEALTNEVAFWESETGVAGIYSSSEYFVETAARLARCFNRPGPDPQAIARCRHKPTQRRALRDAGVPVPRFVHAHSVADACAALDTLMLPVVVKPSCGSGSVGVRLCQTRDELRAHAASLCASTVNERGLPTPADLLVEEFIDAAEYSVETFGHAIVGITRKHVSRAPYFVEYGHDFPWDVPPAAADAIARVVLAGLAAVGLDWGPAHTELRLRGDGPVIMEINPRLAGGYIPELVRLSTGIDLITETIALVCAQPVSIAPRWEGRASIRCLTAPNSGSIATIDGLDAARAVPGVTDVRLYRTPPFEHLIHHDFRDRLGHVIAAGGREDDVAAAADQGLARLHITMAMSAAAAVR